MRTILLLLCLLASMSAWAIPGDGSGLPNFYTDSADGSQLSRTSLWGNNPCQNPNALLQGATGIISSSTPVFLGGATGTQLFICNFAFMSANNFNNYVVISGNTSNLCGQTANFILPPIPTPVSTLIQSQTAASYPTPALPKPGQSYNLPSNGVPNVISQSNGNLCLFAGGGAPNIYYSVVYFNR